MVLKQQETLPVFNKMMSKTQLKTTSFLVMRSRVLIMSHFIFTKRNAVVWWVLCRLISVMPTF